MLSVLAGLGWLFVLAEPSTSGRSAALLTAFLVYSGLLYVAVWLWPDSRSRAYLAVLPLDAVFLFVLLLWSRDPMSSLYLGYYLLVALHAFYFGPAVGLGAATTFAVCYGALAALQPPGHRPPASELLLRVAFAPLVAVSLGLLAHRLRDDERRLRDLNQRLIRRNRTLEQSYRHLSLGRLTSSIAERLCNPAGVIVASAETLRRQAAVDGVAPTYAVALRAIGDEALRVGQIGRSLLALAAPRDDCRRPLDLNALIQETLVLLEAHVGARTRIVRRLAPDVPALIGAEVALRELVVHLVSNALEAAGDGGEVRVETGRGAAERDTIELRVADDGPGISPEHMDRIFNPFFTTKGGQGIGLGLSLSLAIVRRHGGLLDVDTAPGRGARFTVVLPVAGA